MNMQINKTFVPVANTHRRCYLYVWADDVETGEMTDALR